MIKLLTSLARISVAVQPMTGRALSSSEIVSAFHEIGQKAIDGKSVKEGLKLAMKERRENELILIVGSHYTVGEAVQILHVSV